MDLSPQIGEGMYEVTIVLSSSEVGALSVTCRDLHERVCKYRQNPSWWHRRVEHLVGINLLPRKGNWSHVYLQLVKNGVDWSSLHEYENQLLVLVLYDSGADPSENTRLFRDLVLAENSEGLALLLSDKRIRAEQLSYLLLLEAATNGATECLRLLLEDGRVPISTYGGQALIAAVNQCGLAEAKLLLSDPRVDPSSSENEALKIAVQLGLTEIVALLLSHPRVLDKDKRMTSHLFLTIALERNHYPIVRLILQIKPLRLVSFWLLQAIRCSSFEIVKLLFSQSVEEESYKFYRHSLTIARRRQRQDVVELLLDVPQIASLDEEQKRKKRQFLMD